MIEWTEQASAQLEQAYDYIARSQNEDVAARVALHILNSIERLASFPMSGRRGRVKGTRELVIIRTPFIAAYTTEGSRVVILALYHRAQKWPEAL